MIEARRRFRELHESGCFVMPNPWDVGSARLLEGLGFPALATTSSGHAASLGRADQAVGLDEMLQHATALATAVAVPLSVDAERGFADDPAGVAATVERIAATGAAGCSIEDYDPVADAIDAVDAAVSRVAAAAEVAGRYGIVLTARAENHLYGAGDLDDTIGRLRAYRDAGADVVYAPGLRDRGDISCVVTEVTAPVNVLLWPGGPSVDELEALGVRRVSIGGRLAKAAYGAMVIAADALQRTGAADFAVPEVAAHDEASANVFRSPGDLDGAP